MEEKAKENLASSASANGQPPIQKKPMSQGGTKRNYSFLSILMAFVFLLVMILLGERLIFDLNRFLNPAIDKQYNPQYQNYSPGRRTYDFESPETPFSSPKMKSEQSAIGGTRIYYKESDSGRYMMYKIIIHAAVIIPLFLLSFFVYYLKKDQRQLKPILVSLIIFAFWMFFHLLGELTSFVMNEYKNIAVYVILVVLAVILAILAYVVQDRFERKGKVGQ